REPAPRHELVAAREPGIEALEHDRARPAVRSDAQAIDAGFHAFEPGGPLLLGGGVEERYHEDVLQLGCTRLGRIAHRASHGCTQIRHVTARSSRTASPSRPCTIRSDAIGQLK